MSWPIEIRWKAAEKRLFVIFDDGEMRSASAEHLRVNSPSAEVQGHGGDKPPVPVGKENVAIVAMEHVGNYAVRLTFDDGHDTGLYTWNTLRELTELSQ